MLVYARPLAAATTKAVGIQDKGNAAAAKVAAEAEATGRGIGAGSGRTKESGETGVPDGVLAVAHRGAAVIRMTDAAQHQIAPEIWTYEVAKSVAAMGRTTRWMNVATARKGLARAARKGMMGRPGAAQGQRHLEAQRKPSRMGQ